MEIHKPKAAHSWREFLIEIGTIICGILIALGLEQAVEWSRTQAEVREARKALDAEIASNLWVLDFNSGQIVCFNQRLDELKRWRSSPSAWRLSWSSANPYWTFNTSVWQVASAGVLAKLPFEARVAYSQMNRLFETEGRLFEQTLPQLSDLDELTRRSKVDEALGARFDRDMSMIASDYRIYELNARLIRAKAKALGIARSNASDEETRATVEREHAASCRSILERRAR